MATVFLRDRFLAPEEAPRVSLFDRGYLFGDSIFETIRAYDGRAFGIEAHVDRLSHAAIATGIALPLERAALEALVAEAVSRCGAPDVYVRVTVSRGEGGVGIGTVGCDAPVLSIIARPWDGYPPELHARGLEAITLSTRRVPRECLDPAMKTGNYLPNILGRRELERRGLVEGVVRSVAGDVVGGTVSNMFLVAGEMLVTPDDSSDCRPGVTREHVLDLARRLGLDVRERRVTTDELGRADEVFFTNTLMEVMPVAVLDGRALLSAGLGSTTRRIATAYRARVRPPLTPGRGA